MTINVRGILANIMRDVDGWYCVRCRTPLAFETHYKLPSGHRLCRRCNKYKKEIVEVISHHVKKE